MAALSHQLSPETTSLAVEALKALPTAIVGIIAAYIAYRQAKTDRQRLRLEQYDRRRRIYDGVLVYLNAMTGDLQPTTIRDALFKFQRLSSEAHFLFDRDIEKYLEELLANGAQLYRLRQQEPPSRDTGALLLWFHNQYDHALSRFGEALRLSD